MGNYADREIAATIKRVSGKVATPLGISMGALRAAQDAGYVKFREWPSGHWHVTDAGRNFLMNLKDTPNG